MPNIIGQRIRAARKAADLSVRGLAELALGGRKNARLISFWEAGTYTPSIKNLQKIAPHLNISVAELIDESSISKAEISAPTQPQ